MRLAAEQPSCANVTAFSAPQDPPCSLSGEITKPQLSGSPLAARLLWDSCKQKIYFLLLLVYVNLIITKPKTLEGKKAKVSLLVRKQPFCCQSRSLGGELLLPEAADSGWLQCLESMQPP